MLRYPVARYFWGGWLAGLLVSGMAAWAAAPLPAAPETTGTLLAAAKPVRAKQDKYRLSEPVKSLDSASPLKGQVYRGADAATLSANDVENMKTLWQATIDKNPVIQFCLKQLATPPELRYAHSSMMSRTLGSLLTGVGMLPYVAGADQYSAAATNIGANLADRALQQSHRTDPAKLPSDIELVELSGLVQQLQKSLTEHYLGYKTGLSRVHELDSMLNNLQRGTVRPEMALLYQNAVYERLQAMQSAKSHFLALERLVGVDNMQKLRFETAPSQVGVEHPQATDAHVAAQH